MVAFNESKLVPCNPFRARPRVQGRTFATIQRPLHHGASSKRSSSHSQALLGNSPTSHKRLQRADHSNQQYSILSISNSSGAVVERVAYQAYGQPTFTNAAGTTLSSSAKATRYSYTGREWDPSLELHHFRARLVSGLNGVFLSRDPIGYEGGDSNLFRLLGGSSLSRKDASGLDWTWLDFFNHYWSGFGSTVDLADIGLLDDFIAFHQNDIGRNSFDAQRSAMQLLHCNNGPGSYQATQYSGPIHEVWAGEQWLGNLLPLGSSDVYIRRFTSISWRCESCCAHDGDVTPVSASLTIENSFILRDSFTNPYSAGADDNDMARRQGECVNTCLRRLQRINGGITGQEFEACKNRCLARYPTKGDGGLGGGYAYGIVARFNDSRSEQFEWPCGMFPF